MKGAAPRRRLHAPLALQIMGLLVAGLLAAQGATLILTLLLPPAPKPQYGLDDIAAALKGGRVPVRSLRPLVRTVRGDPPSLQSAGWLVSEQSHDDLARRLGADPGDVRLLFYSPLPFAGAGERPTRALQTASADGRGRRIVMASLLPLSRGALAAVQVALPQGVQVQGFPGPGGAQRGGGPVAGAGYPGGGLPGGTMPGGAAPGGALPGGGFPGGTPPGGPFPAQGGGLPAGRGPIGFPGGGATTTGQGAGPTATPAGGSFPADPDGPIITAPWPRQPTQPLPPTTGPASPPGRPTFPGGVGGSGGTSGRPHGPAGPIGRGPIGRGRIDPGPLTGDVIEPAAPEPEPGPVQPSAPRTRDVQAAPALPAPARVDAPAAAPAPSLQTAIRPPSLRPAAPPPPQAHSGYILPPAPARGLFGIAPAPFVEGDFVAAWRVGPGRWATVQPAPEPFPNSWQRRVLLWFVVSFALVAPLGWLFARRLAAPLAAFSAAAERLGRDPSGAVLALDGPAEIGRAAGAFNLMQQRLKRYIDDRTAMVGAISHDLRTPLARMRFRIERAPPDMKRGMTEDIVQMEEMIASVLAFIRDASEPSLRERVDLRSIVECVVDDAALVGGDAVLDPGAPASVEVDSLGVQRVVTNLVENALKYGRSAHVRLFTEGGEAVTEVVDAGPGLPEAELERVFLPFYRAQPARTMNKGGIGLGLSVSRSIARAHGGDVKLYNAGEGLVAQLRLPLAAAAA